METLLRNEVAKELGVSPAAIPSAIKNGTLPIGAVFEGERERTVIIKKRWELWKEGTDLKRS